MPNNFTVNYICNFGPVKTALPNLMRIQNIFGGFIWVQHKTQFLHSYILAWKSVQFSIPINQQTWKILYLYYLAYFLIYKNY